MESVAKHSIAGHSNKTGQNRTEQNRTEQPVGDAHLRLRHACLSKPGCTTLTTYAFDTNSKAYEQPCVLGHALCSDTLCSDHKCTCVSMLKPQLNPGVAQARPAVG